MPPDFDIPDDPNSPNVMPGSDEAAAPVAPKGALTNAPGVHGLNLESRMAEPPAEIPDDQFVSDEDKFGTGQQYRIGIEESVGRGIAGPLFTYAEKKLGVDPENIRARKEASDGFGTAAEMAGFGVGAVTGAGEAALLEKLGTGVKAITGLSKATSISGKIAGGAAKLGTEMAALQGGEEATKLILNDPHQTAANAAANVGLAAVLGTAMGGAFSSVPAVWSKTAGPQVEKILNRVKMDWGLGEVPVADADNVTTIHPALRNVLSIFGGVPKETVDKYVADSHEIMAAPEFNDVYNNVLEQISDINEALDQKRINFRGAKDKFGEFLKEQRTALQQKGYDLGAADTMAQEALKQAQGRLATGLQEQALEAAPKAFSAVQKLKDQALEMSASAREILDQTPGELKLKPIYEAIRPMQDKLYSQGFPTLAEELGKQMDVFAHQYGDKIAYSDAKSMIQGLQQRGKWNFGANEIANGLSPYFNQLSGIMNAALKKAVPEYEKAMLPTADAFNLLEKLDRYATPEAANKSALALKSAANYVNEMPVLKKLEEMTGINFTHQLEHYSNPATREAMSKALPEFANAQRVAEALHQLKDPETRAALEKAAYLSKEWSEVTRAEKSLEYGVARKESLKGLTESSLEGRMKAVMAGRSLHGRAALEGVKGMEDMTVPQILDLIAIREAFDKGAMNGSRNVNMMSKIFGSLGAGAGSIAGIMTGGALPGAGVGGLAGTAAGAYVGGLLDKEGPALVKKYLDRYISQFGDLPKALGASPEATKAGLLHFLGKDAPADATAFKSAVNYIQNAKGGLKALTGAAKSIFESGKVLLPHLMPDDHKTEKANERAKEIRNNPKAALNFGGGLSTYMPEHGAALGESASRATTLINAHRPQAQRNAPLDPEMPPTLEQEKAFSRNLQIAQQPLVTLQFLKDGTLTLSDLQALHEVHPRYYQSMKAAVSEAMQNHLSGDNTIPYSLRQSLSLFLNQTLDSSLNQPNLMAVQTVFAMQKAQAQAPQAKTQKLSKASGQYKTQQEAAVSRSQKA